MARDEVWEDIKGDKSTVYGEPMLDMFLKLTDTLDREHWNQLNPRQKSLTNADIRTGFASNVREAEAAAKEELKNPNQTLRNTLISGAYNGDIDLCRWSIDKGYHVDLHGALVAAAEKGHAETCQFLIEKGARPSAKAIGAAKNPEVRKILVNAWREKVGSSIRLRDASDPKEAERAVRAGAKRLSPETLDKWFKELKVDLVRWWLNNEELLDRKEAEKKHPWFFTMALERAAEAGDVAMCRAIIEGKLVRYTRTALEGAAYWGHIKVCKLILDNGEFTPDSLESPLYKAAKGGKLEVCKLLVQRGAKPSLNALGGAVESGKLEVCRWFVEDMEVPVSFGLRRDGSSPEVKEYITQKLAEQG